MKSIHLCEIQNKILEGIDKSAIKSWTWQYWLFFYAVIPSVLLAVPQIIKSVELFAGQQTPPYDIVNQTFVLDIYHPTILSMFLANYTHIEIIHLCSNLFFYLVFVTIIFFLEKNKETLVKASAFFFIGLPFLVSLITILYLGSINAVFPSAKGFSGIVFAFLGYSMYLICKEVCEKYINIEQYIWKKYSMIEKTRYFGFLILYNVFILLCVPIMGMSAGVFFNSGGSLGNGIAHFGGFICGLLIPIVFGIYQNRQIKNFDTTLLIQIIMTIGIYGMYLIKIKA